MTKPPSPRRRLSKRLSRDLKGNLKFKTEEEPVEKDQATNANSVSSNTDIGDSTQSITPRIQLQSSRRRSLIPIPTGKVKAEVERVEKSLSSNTEAGDSSFQRQTLRRRSLSTVFESTREENDLVEEAPFCNTATEESNQFTAEDNSKVKAEEIESDQESLRGNTDIEPLNPPTIKRKNSKRVSWGPNSSFVDTKIDEFDPSNTPQRAHSMKSLQNIKGKGKAKEVEPIVEKTNFDDAETQSLGNGYATIRSADGSFVSYANGKETMRGDEWGLIQIAEDPEPSRMQQVLDSVAESVRSIAQAAQLPVGKGSSKGTEKEESVTYQHNPLVVHGTPQQKQTKMERIVENLELLTDLVESVKKLNIFKKNKPHRNWDRRGAVEDRFTNITYEEILKWTETQIADHHEHNLVVLTTKQLKELRSKLGDKIVYAHPVCQDPNSTPDTENRQSEEELREELEQGCAGIWGEPDHENPETEHKKDLRKLLGAYKGFHIVPGDGDFDLFYGPNNLSDYYGMPLIEPGHNPKYEVGSRNKAEIERSLARNVDPDGNGFYEARDMDQSFLDPNHEPRKKHTFRARPQCPGQAMILYLMYRMGGYAPDYVANLITSCDAKLIYENDNLYWNGYRIPQHTELTDIIVDKIIQIAPAPKESWQEKSDAVGLIPPQMVALKSRIRERILLQYAVKVVENYLWYRFFFEKPHKDVKSSATPTPYDY